MESLRAQSACTASTSGLGWRTLSTPREALRTRRVYSGFCSSQCHSHSSALCGQWQRSHQLGGQRSTSRVCPPARALPFDTAWAPNAAASSIAPQLFAFSLFPYLVFLYFLTTSGKTPRVVLFGFYFLLVFVGVTIPAGIYAKTHYGTNLANVDWLHGSAEMLLTITNLLLVVGLRQAIRDEEAKRKETATTNGQVPTSGASAAQGAPEPAPQETNTK